MEENSAMDLLQHYNQIELESMVGKNEKQISILHKAFLQDFHKFLKNIRLAIKNNDNELFISNAELIEAASVSVCFEIMALLADDLKEIDISDEQKIKDKIEDIENEFEIIQEIIQAV